MIILTILAQNITLPWGGNKSLQIQGVSGFSFTNLAGVVTKVVQFSFAFAGIGLLVMLLSAGFSFLTSGGGPKKMEMARGRLTSAITGFIIIFVAYWAAQAAGIIFGLAEIRQIFR